MGGVRRGGSTNTESRIRYIALLFAIAIAVVVTGSRLEAKDDTEQIPRDMAAKSVVSESRHWRTLDEAGPPSSVPLPTEEPVSEPVPPEPVAEPEPLSGVEAAICSLPWECSIALRVAACESGPDYAAGYNDSGHAGTFQLSPIHAWRFSKRGLDFWADALTLEWNLDVAYELWTERWWYAWSCF